MTTWGITYSDGDYEEHEAVYALVGDGGALLLYDGVSSRPTYLIAPNAWFTCIEMNR